MSFNKTNLIGLSARMGGGKDLAATIIQYLTSDNSNIPYSDWIISWNSSAFEIKKYADKLKDIVCLLIGCSRKNLEDRKFKETELGPEWDRWEWYDTVSCRQQLSIVKPEGNGTIKDLRLIKMTPRKLLQQLGTECGRQIIHPNIWVNSLFADYKAFFKGVANTEKTLNGCYHHKACDNCGNPFLQHKRAKFCDECILDDSFQVFPNWVISDVRFPANEGKAISDRNGINIGIKRAFSLRFPEYASLEDERDPYIIPVELQGVNKELFTNLTHESEELMGDFEWCDYVIENNGTIDDFIDNIRTILIKENIIEDGLKV